jgi:hypothetical protein
MIAKNYLNDYYNFLYYKVSPFNFFIMKVSVSYIVTGKKISVEVDKHDSVFNLKEKISSFFEMKPEDQILKFGGRNLNNDEELGGKDIVNGSSILLFKQKVFF